MSNHIAGVELDIVEPSVLWTDHLAILRVSICLYTWLLVTEMTSSNFPEVMMFLGLVFARFIFESCFVASTISQMIVVVGDTIDPRYNRYKLCFYL